MYRKLHNSPDMFRGVKHTILRGTHWTLKSKQAQLLKLLKHHFMPQYIEICQLLMRWKLFTDKSSATEYKSSVIKN
jgi:hypothetical protein